MGSCYSKASMLCCSMKDEQFDPYEFLVADKLSQSVEVPADNKEVDCGPVHRHKLCPNEFIDYISPRGDERYYTCWDAFEQAAKHFSDNNCLGTRVRKENGKPGHFVWQSYSQVYREVLSFASSLRELGVKKGEAIGIYSVNRAEWTMTALSCYSQTFKVVALYDSLGPDAVKYIVNHAEIRVAVVSKQKIDQLLAVIDSCQNLKILIQMEERDMFNNKEDFISEEHKQIAKEKGLELYGWNELMKKGSDMKNKPVETKPDDIAYIMYTSGTTGVPKGVILTQNNVTSCAGSTTKIRTLSFTNDDRYLSFLPLAHILESAVQLACLSYGSSIGFFSGSVKTLIEDIQELKPTTFCGVPRVFSRIYEKVMSGISEKSGIEKRYITNALIKCSYKVRRGLPIEPNDDPLGAFRKVSSFVGLDKIRLMISGAAPLPSYLKEFLSVVFSPTDGVVEGYGLTETSSCASASSITDPTIGHVGPPAPACEMKLRDVVEMGYTSSDDPPRGEVMIRGPLVFKGYYKDEEETKKVLSEDGWFATGDIGRWNPNGTLTIIDRKKNLFKLAQGEYVAVEKIESVYGSAPMIGQVWVYGNSFKTKLMGVVCVAVDEFEKLASEKKWIGQEKPKLLSPKWIEVFQEVVREHYEEVKEIVMVQMEEVAKARGLFGYERVKDIIIETDIDGMGFGFTVENGCMTPTFKIRRNNLKEKYVEQLKELYAKHGEPARQNENWKS